MHFFWKVVFIGGIEYLNVGVYLVSVVFKYYVSIENRVCVCLCDSHLLVRILFSEWSCGFIHVTNKSRRLNHAEAFLFFFYWGKDVKQVLCDCLLHVMLLLTMDAKQLCKFRECELFFIFIFLFSTISKKLLQYKCVARPVSPLFHWVVKYCLLSVLLPFNVGQVE